jgi:hypothetical protein
MVGRVTLSQSDCRNRNGEVSMATADDDAERSDEEEWAHA